MDSIISDLRTYFLGCPFLKENAALNIDFLSVNGVEYSIDTVPSNPTVETYIDGSRECQCTFLFSSREYYNAQSSQNIQNTAFYQSLSDWIYLNNIKRILPNLSDKKQSAVSLKVLTAGYLFDENMESARYQIQCRFNYIQEV